MFVSTVVTLVGGKKEKVYYLTEEAKDKLRKIFNEHNYLARKVNELRSELYLLRPLIVDLKKKTVLELLQDDGNPHTFQWIENRVGRYSFEAVNELEKDGVLETHRSGSQLMFSLVKEA